MNMVYYAGCVEDTGRMAGEVDGPTDNNLVCHYTCGLRSCFWKTARERGRVEVNSLYHVTPFMKRQVQYPKAIESEAALSDLALVVIKLIPKLDI